MENHPLKPPLQTSASPRHLEPDPNDIEKLRKWQEDRIARKLRGEYESAVLHLSDLVRLSMKLCSSLQVFMLSVGQ